MHLARLCPLGNFFLQCLTAAARWPVGPGGAVNSAETLLSVVPDGTTQLLLVPLQSPPQPVKVEPPVGVAVSVTV